MIALPPNAAVSVTYANHGEYYVCIDWARDEDYTATADSTVEGGVLYIYDSGGTDQSLNRYSDIIEYHQTEPGCSAITYEVIELPKPPVQPPLKRFVMRPSARGYTSPRRWRPRPRRNNIGVHNWHAKR